MEYTCAICNGKTCWPFKGSYRGTLWCWTCSDALKTEAMKQGDVCKHYYETKKCDKGCGKVEVTSSPISGGTVVAELQTDNFDYSLGGVIRPMALDLLPKISSILLNHDRMVEEEELEYKRYLEMRDSYFSTLGELRMNEDELVKLRSDNERLVSALKDIRDCMGCEYGKGWSAPEDVLGIAIETLKSMGVE